MNFKLVGHRGAGANGPFPMRPTQLMENTVQSFTEAVRLGAHMVEFDVQLTKDMVPVVYHDFFVCGTKKHYLVSDIDYSELIDLVINGNEPLEKNPNVSWDGERCGKCPKKTFDYELIKSDIPTLSEVFDNSPSVGFNIEIKYPTLDEIEDQQLRTPVSVDQYCETIVKSIKSGREIIISSFHPEICLWIRKNTNYTVYFLTDAGESASRFDPRLSSLHAAFDFARLNHLHGIVANAAGLLKAKHNLVGEILKCMNLYTYGKENCMTDRVKAQLDVGVQGIITDDLRLVSKFLSPKADL